MMKIRRTTRLISLSTRLVVLFALCGSAFAQQVTPPASSPLSPTTDTTSSDSDTSSSSSSSSGSQLGGSSGSQLGQRSSLTAAQITLILQQKPELVVELKSLVADQLQQQGVAAQADSITDEMLLNQISTNAALRSSITVWLRARGYVSADEMDRLLSSSAAEDAEQSPLSGLSSGVPLDASGLSGSSGALSGVASASGQPPMDNNSIATARSKGSSATRAARPTDKQTRSSTDEPETLRLPAP